MLRLPLRLGRRHFASISPVFVTKSYPEGNIPPFPESLDSIVLRGLAQTASPKSLHEIVREYLDNTGTVLPQSLKYESRPSLSRRVNTSERLQKKNIALIAHCVQSGNDHKITVSTGFRLNAESPIRGESLIVTCAHSLEEIRHSSVMSESALPQDSNTANVSASFVITNGAGSERLQPVSLVPSALSRSDILLLSCPDKGLNLDSIPVSPYPVPVQAEICAHFVTHVPPCDDESGWSPWISGTWSKWVDGTIMGYRDFSGGDTKPGTYDSLSHVLFMPVPSHGSSGGPIISKESGAVIGLISGSRIDSRAEGVRGWGTPSESIFEMFSLPGLEGKQ